MIITINDCCCCSSLHSSCYDSKMVISINKWRYGHRSIYNMDTYDAKCLSQRIYISFEHYPFVQRDIVVYCYEPEKTTFVWPKGDP